MLGFRQCRKQPFHALRVEAGIDLDGRMAGDGGGDASATGLSVFYLRGLLRVAENLLQHALQLAAFKADGCGLDGQRARAKWLGLDKLEALYNAGFTP